VDLIAHPVVFEPSDPPRAGRIGFWGTGGAEELTVVVPDGDAAAPRTVPVCWLPVADAVPVLLAAGQADQAHPAGRFWGAAAALALRLVARGRILPGVSRAGFDAWRIGPLDPDDARRLRALAAAMPPHARAVPLPGTWDDPMLPDADRLLRDFLDAVADVMPRGPAATRVAGGPLYAAAGAQPVPHLRAWARQVAAGLDAGVRISLRLLVADDSGAASVVVQVHSLADPGLVIDAAELWHDAMRDAGQRPGRPVGLDERFGGRVRIDTVLAVRRAARAWPVLDRLLQTSVPDRLELSDDELADLIGEGAARLAAGGVDVHWPRHLVRELTATAVVGSAGETDTDDEMPTWFGLDRLLTVNWRIALGDQPLTEAELDRLAEAHRPVVRLRDQWTVVDPHLLARARQRQLPAITAIDALGAALTGTVELPGTGGPLAAGGVADPTRPATVGVTATGWLERLRVRLTEEPSPAPQPPALKATLRAYQLTGLRWLDRLTSLGLGGCLADDMGLGKTIMLIALHLHRQPDHPTLVVCPASLLGNWEREIERFAPGTPVCRYHGGGRTLDGVTEGFVLTTYGTMRVDAVSLAGHRFGLLVADEAQHVKNPRSGTARALRTIPAPARVALTGTPVENNLSELWAILDWTVPGLLGTLAGFRARWARPVEVDRDPEAADRLARLVRPFLLRRRKSDPGIAPELPPKTETDQPVPLTAEQAGLYQAVVRETMAGIRDSIGMERRGLVMKLLTALKQICNHPAHYLKEAEPRLSDRSGKLELLDELLETILAEDGGVLVFSQYVAMARLIQRHLRDRGVPTQLLHGGTPVQARDEMVSRFQTGEVPVFLLSLRAAGTGLNLTRADHVIHYDRWWNPAVEDQATDRAYRIGQTRPVQVHRMIAEGTVEDRIAEMLAGKRQLADAVLASGEAAFTELTDAELVELVELREVR
jgi:superfamily II DNA or RNA helicase